MLAIDVWESATEATGHEPLSHSLRSRASSTASGRDEEHRQNATPSGLSESAGTTNMKLDEHAGYEHGYWVGGV